MTNANIAQAFTEPPATLNRDYKQYALETTSTSVPSLWFDVFDCSPSEWQLLSETILAQLVQLPSHSAEGMPSIAHVEIIAVFTLSSSVYRLRGDR